MIKLINSLTEQSYKNNYYSEQKSIVLLLLHG